MDPLSLSCSIVALLTTSAQLGSALYFFASNVSDVPNIIVRVTSETQALTAIFGQLQTLILGNGRKPDENRLCMVSLDQLVTLLTGCMCTYSELEKELADGQSGKEIENTLRLWTRFKWTMKTPELERLLGDLQLHKSNLNLMLGIMHCRSNDEASSKLESLCAAVQELMESHRRISAQLRAIMNSPNAPHIDNNDDDDDIEFEILNEANNKTIDEDRASNLAESAAHSLNTSFELVLRQTRVYRYANIRDRYVSPQSSVMGYTSRSTLSDLSIADVVSNRSVISLPFWPHDIWNLGGSNLGPIEEVPTNFELISGLLSPQPEVGYFETAAEPLVGKKLSALDKLPPQTDHSVTSCNYTLIPAPLSIGASPWSSPLPPSSQPLSPCLKSFLLSDSDSASPVPSPSTSPDGADSDHIPCIGCGEVPVLEEGRAYQIDQCQLNGRLTINSFTAGTY
ncbi:hypothetical protein BDD12DRAFT_978924 [Trichophaea hybrida]|nr:hypothetical protein BDD12DRAFT_978924 [Trichophaea hybrida]